MSDDDGFLARWSQRKRRAAEEARQPAPAPAEATPEPEAEPLDLSLLPDVDALTPETDFALFLQKGVPDSIRNAALRRMWALDPAIRDYVGDALDYAWDWNAPGGVPGGGELGAGYDAAKAVARIFGDAPEDENVIEDVAMQQEPTPSVARDPGQAGLELSEVSENNAELCISSDAEVQTSTVIAPQKRRRHGGATPTA